MSLPPRGGGGGHRVTTPPLPPSAPAGTSWDWWDLGGGAMAGGIGVSVTHEGTIPIPLSQSRDCPRVLGHLSIAAIIPIPVSPAQRLAPSWATSALLLLSPSQCHQLRDWPRPGPPPHRCHRLHPNVTSSETDPVLGHLPIAAIVPIPVSPVQGLPPSCTAATVRPHPSVTSPGTGPVLVIATTLDTVTTPSLSPPQPDPCPSGGHIPSVTTQPGPLHPLGGGCVPNATTLPR